MLEEIKKLPHIQPAEGDKFKEELIAPDCFQIKYLGTFIRVKIRKPEPGQEAKGPDVELLKYPEYYDDKMKKLIGYIIYKLVPRYT